MLTMEFPGQPIDAIMGEIEDAEMQLPLPVY